MSGGFYSQKADARDWGVIADGIHASGWAMCRAINDCAAEGGVELMVPPGVVKCEQPVDNPAARVKITCAGDNAWSDAGGLWTPGTMFVKDFDGAGLYSQRSPSGAGLSKMRGGGLIGAVLHGNGRPGVVLDIDSVAQVQMRAYITGATGAPGAGVAAVMIHANAALGEAADTQDCQLHLFVRQVDTPGEREVTCVRLDGPAGANFSQNWMGSYLRLTCQHWNGHGLYARTADMNEIMVRARRFGGSGQAVRMGGRTAALSVGGQSNFMSVSCDAPIYAEGIGDAGVVGGVTNVIRPDRGNGTPNPTAGAGSNWVIVGPDGELENHALVRSVMADSVAAALWQRGLRGVETNRIFNGSGLHEVLQDWTTTWGRRINPVNGDFEHFRMAGAAGRFNLPMQSAYAGLDISVGAPDSAGLGFRALRVPN